MAHFIEQNQLAYKGAKPWHGLGFEVPADATGSQMLEIAGLNWEVHTRLLQMQDGAGLHYGFGSNLDGYRAIVRADTDEVFAVKSNIWKPVQNREIVDFFRDYCEAGHASMETVGALRGGAVVWALARLNGASDANIGNGVKDEMRGYLLLITSHDGSLATTGVPTQVRAVCWNTVRAALKMNGRNRQGKKQADEFRMIHTSRFDEAKKNEARQVMGMAIDQIARLNEISRDLAHVRIDDEGRLQFLEQLLLNDGSILNAVVSDSANNGSVSALDAAVANTQGNSREVREKRLGRVGKAILDAIVNSPGADLPTAKDTLYGAVNGVTFYSDHTSSAFSESNRMYNAWFGGNNKLKQDALTVAVNMAGLNVN